MVLKIRNLRYAGWVRNLTWITRSMPTSAKTFKMVRLIWQFNCVVSIISLTEIKNRPDYAERGIFRCPFFTIHAETLSIVGSSGDSLQSEHMIMQNDVPSNRTVANSISSKNNGRPKVLVQVRNQFRLLHSSSACDFDGSNCAIRSCLVRLDGHAFALNRRR